MKSRNLILMILLCPASAGAQHSGYPISPVPFTAVSLQDRFWKGRIETNRTVTIPYAFRQCEETGRVRNFEIADSVLEGTISQGTFCSRYGFDDSDVYKIIEGASYSLQTLYDGNLDQYLDTLIAKISRAQEKDGYLYTMRTIRPDKSWAKERWVNARSGSSHELYNLGHLYEAAVAHFGATGKRSLLDIALKSADLVCATFGPEKMHSAPGHQEIEIGLVKLFQTTGERKYLDLAKFFLDQRGHPKGEIYNQDELPVIEQSEAVGHAVRAGYMYSAMADVSALTGESAYRHALEKIWKDVVGRKLYLTGGLGAAGDIEGFGAPYELPNLSAYCETCASIAEVFWNYRMFRLQGEGKYLDVLERVLYNAFLSGISMKGDRFFYPNPLESFKSRERSPWFACACCPSNIVRFVPQIPGYIYAVENDTLYVNLFVASSARVELSGGGVNVSQSGDYPWSGDLRIAVDPGKSRVFTVALRVPGWAEGHPVPSDLYHYLGDRSPHVRVTINGEALPLQVERGFLHIHRLWKKGDSFRLNLDMLPRWVVARHEVGDDRGRVALERGPIVFCLEGPDNREGHVLDLVLKDSVPLQADFSRDVLGGVQVISGQADAVQRELDGGLSLVRNVGFRAIPYYAWAHRGPSEMTVWPARKVDAARPLPAPTLARRATLKTSGGQGSEALTDQLIPRSSHDHSLPYFHWWPKKGTLEWLEYDLGAKTNVSSVQVYWYDDTGRGECRVPKSWRVLIHTGEEWVPVRGASSFTTEKDRMNRVTFDPVETDRVKLEIQLREGASAGLYEWSLQ